MAPGRRPHAVIGVVLCILFQGCGPGGEVAIPPPERITPSPVAPSAPEPEFDLGREIYLHGRGSGGAPVTAALPDGMPLPPAAVACANCHGPDGRGRPEGGIVPTDITRANLTKPYGGTQPSGRRFSTYDDRLVVRAITLGVDSGGKRLAPTMPRYQLTHAEAASLAAYLRRLGEDPEPGVTGTEVRVGLVSLPGEFADSVIQLVIEAEFDRLNAAGGVYGRRLRLVHTKSPSLPTEAWGRQFLAGADVFALLGGFADRVPGLLAVAETQRVPVVGVISPPPLSRPASRYCFYLFGGLEDQCRVLATFAAAPDRPKPARLALVGGNLNPQLASAIRAEWGSGRGRAMTEAALAPDGADAAHVAQKLRDDGTDLCLMVAPGSVVGPFVRAANLLGWKPEILIPAMLAGSDLAENPLGAPDRWVFAFPTLRADHTPAGLAGYAALADSRPLPAEHRSVQLAALASTKLLVEAFNRCGRDLTRERLIAVLESGSEFATGLTPPLRFNPNRRVGARGAYLARPGGPPGTFTPIGGWRETH